MRVVVGLRALLPGRIGGLETYVREILSAWGETRRDDEIIVLLNPESAPTFHSPGPWLRFETVPELHDLGAWRRAIVSHSHSHSPAVYFSPVMMLDPPDPGLPAVTNIVDLQHEFYPEFFTPELLEMRHLHFPLSARRSAAVVTLSRHAKTSIVERLGAPAARVHDILLAAAEDFRRPAAPGAVAAFREKHGLPEVFGYYPANFWPHKNHAVLFRALQLLRHQRGDCPHLALSGFAGDKQAQVAQKVESLGLADRVHFLGYLDRADLPLAYRAATFMVFPSLYEGFGIPVAEAFASGLPVICSNATSLPELAEGAALSVDATDPGAIAGAIHRVCTDAALRASLIEKGIARAAELTWRRTADRTWAVIAAVAAASPSQQPAFERLAHIRIQPDGCIALTDLPPVGDSAPMLCFPPPGGEPGPGAADLAATRFQESGLPLLVGSLIHPDGRRETPAPEILPMKSGDGPPLSALWVAPAAAAGLLDWLRRQNTPPTAYETALWLATRHAFGAAPELELRLTEPLPPAPAPAIGARLSQRYFGVPDGNWERRWAEAMLEAFPGARLLAGRHRTRGALLRGLREIAHRRLTGKWRSSPWRWPWRWIAPAFGSAPSTTLHPDGWMGRRSLVRFNRPADGQIRFTVESPAWPFAAPPVLTVRLGAKTLTTLPLTRRGTFRLAWTWPDGRDTLDLTLLSSATFVPAELGIGADERELSFRVLPE